MAKPAFYFDNHLAATATNRLLYSEQLDNAAWSKSNASVLVDNITAPDGTVSVEALIEASDVAQVHSIAQSITPPSAGAFAASIYAKAGSRTRMRLALLGNGGTHYVLLDANLSTAAITASDETGSGVLLRADIVAQPSGWYRIELVGRLALLTSLEFRVELLDASGNQQYNGDGTSGLYLWGAQLEIAESIGAYLKTTSAAITTPTSAVSVSSTAAGFSVDNLFDWRHYTWWKPATDPASGSVDIFIDMGSPTAADYLLIAGHNLASTGCTLEVIASDNAFVSANYSIASAAPTTDAPLLLSFTSASHRWWMLRFYLGAAPTIAIAAIGAKLELPTWLPQGFDPTGRQVESTTNRNANGQPLGRVIDFESWQQTISLQSIPWSWIRDTFTPAWESHLRSKPFGFCWEPGSYADEVRLVVAGDRFDTPHRSGLLTDLSLDLSGVVE